MCNIRVGYYYTFTPVGTSHMFRKGPFMQHHQPSTGSPSPYHSYKLCLLTNRTTGSPTVALDKNRSVQALTKNRWPAGSTSGENTSGARHSNPSIPKAYCCGGWKSGWWEFLLHLPPPPGRPGGIALSTSEKFEVLAYSLETQFQLVTDSSVLAVIEMVDLASYFLTLASEPKLTNHDEVHEAIRGLQFSKATDPNGILNRALKHLPKRAVSLLLRSSMRFSAHITFPKCGSTLEWSLSLSRGRIQHCPLPMGPLVSWSRLVNYLKRFYYLGSYV